MYKRQDIKCAVSGMRPEAAVMVATVRALKAHSGRYRLAGGRDLPAEMLRESVEDVRAGAPNLLYHLGIVRGFGLEPVVAVNVFPTDHGAEVDEALRIVRETGARAATARPVTDGGAGCLELADAVVEACEQARRAGATPGRALYLSLIHI